MLSKIKKSKSSCTECAGFGLIGSCSHVFISYIKVSDATCGQVWWPILGISALHLSHPFQSAHTQHWTHTHTRSSGQPFMLRHRGAVGGSVSCSRAPQSWYWGWREHCTFTPLTDNPCQTWDSNPQPLGYKSDSLTFRPRLEIKTPVIHNFWLRNSHSRKVALLTSLGKGKIHKI